MAMLLMEYDGGGIKEASSWSNAYSNAKSFIIVIILATYNTAVYRFSLVIPKSLISSATTYYVNGAGNPSGADWYANTAVSSTGISTTVYRSGDSSSITVSHKIFYD